MKQISWKERNDSELVLAALLGNLEAFDELVIRFRPAVFAVARQFAASNEDAEDIMQDVFLLAFKALPQLDELNKFGAWLYAITRNRAMRYQKNASKHESRPNIDALILQHSKALAPNPADIIEKNETHQKLNELLDKLPSEYQIALKLFYWEEMPLKRISDFLALPITTVKWRLYKGRQLLKEQLEKLWAR
ncbi:MAG: RNA polymerase sigma factor [Candidatus Poribacteria bacterium]